MTKSDTALAEPVAETAIALFQAPNPVAVLSDAKKFEDFYSAIEKEVRSHVPDLTTDKGRKAIASLAFKVVKTKTALDDAGKQLTEDKRKEIALVDDARRNIRTKLDALRDEVRKPLTEWEEAEERRIDRCNAVLAKLKDAAVVTVDDSSQTVVDRLDDIEAVTIAEAEFSELFEFATDAKARTILALTAGRDRLLKEEADRAELARLRAEQEERERREATDRARAEEEARRQAEAAAEAKRKADAEAAEQARAEAAKKAEEERIAKAAREAEETARADALRQAREAAEAAKAEREAQERAHAEALAAERRRADEAEAARKAEADRAAKAEADRKAEEARVAAEEKRRAEDRAHRGTIMGEAKAAITEASGVTDDQARVIVLAIVGRSVPHVTLQF